MQTGAGGGGVVAVLCAVYRGTTSPSDASDRHSELMRACDATCISRFREGSCAKKLWPGQGYAYVCERSRVPLDAPVMP